MICAAISYLTRLSLLLKFLSMDDAMQRLLGSNRSASIAFKYSRNILTIYPVCYSDPKTNPGGKRTLRFTSAVLLPCIERAFIRLRGFDTVC